MNPKRGPVYGFREPKPNVLAKQIARRCEAHVKKFAKQHGDLIDWKGVYEDENYTSFSLKGRSLRDDRQYHEDHEQKFGWAPDQEKIKAYRVGTRWLPGEDGKPIRYGYELYVRIVHEPWTIDIQTNGVVPYAILKCLSASYNSLTEDFT